MFNLFLATVSSDKRPQIETDKVTFQGAGRYSKSGEQRGLSAEYRIYFYANVQIYNAYFYNCLATDTNLKWQMSCGGAIFLNKCSLQFERLDSGASSLFSECQAKDKGGAIYAYDSVCNIFQVNFVRCYAGNEGGAVYHDGMRYSRPVYTSDENNRITIEHCTFKGNLADLYGGAVAVKGSVSLKLLNTRFLDNGAAAGGALYGDYSDITMTDNLFVLNYADHSRGCKICDIKQYSNYKYLPAGACLIRSSPEYLPCNVYSSNNCFNQNYILNNKWSNKDQISVNILLLWAVRFKSENDKMKWYTVNYIDNMTLAAQFNNNKKPTLYSLVVVHGYSLRSFQMTGTSQDVENCKIDGHPMVITYVPTPYPTLPTPDPTPPTPYPTVAPPRTPGPTQSTPEPLPPPTQTPIPTPPATAPTPNATLTPVPTEFYVPTIIPSNASIIEESNATDCGQMCKSDNQTMPPGGDVTIHYETPAVNSDDQGDNAHAAVIGRNTAAPDESAVGFVIAAIAAVAAVGVIAGIIYTLTRSKQPPMDFENAEQVNMDNSNPAVENDNPIYNHDAAQDPFANEFEDA